MSWFKLSQITIDQLIWMGAKKPPSEAAFYHFNGMRSGGVK